MKKVFFILLTITQPIFAQTIFQAFEVTQPAEPKGGTVYLKEFLTTNLQMPFQARLQHVKGRSFVSFVVEPDGTITDLKITKGLHPLCDLEALRLMSLFKSWQPALKDGQPVRQALTYPVLFPEVPVSNYDSTKHSLVHYFSDKFELTQDPKMYYYRQITPVDERGFVNGDIMIEKLIEKKWEPFTSAKFNRKEMMYHISENGVTDSLKAYQITVRDRDWNEYAPVMTFQMNGQLLATTEYDTKRRPMSYEYYYSNGLVREKKNTEGTIQRIVSWYDNGQIREIKEIHPTSIDKNEEEIVLNLWSKDGTVLVKDGNGKGIYTHNDYKGKKIIEKGDFVNGKKNGTWVARLEDGTFYYEETFDNNKLIRGRLKEDGQGYDYTELGHQPEFAGGRTALLDFLGKTITYPKLASKNNISGKVFLSFTVCEDGSLCNYEIIKGIGGGCDEEALRVVKKMNGKWLPGVQRGKKVRVKYNLPVSFVLE